MLFVCLFACLYVFLLLAWYDEYSEEDSNFHVDDLDEVDASRKILHKEQHDSRYI